MSVVTKLHVKLYIIVAVYYFVECRVDMFCLVYLLYTVQANQDRHATRSVVHVYVTLLNFRIKSASSEVCWLLAEMLGTGIYKNVWWLL